ncbi:unnamed protein product [Peronospora farinosa]|uniref:Uncharacterized protein n=1 Tax=Peronospora farinosa TaxID=134698 RepID=A0AAV0TPZ6_9STRA|nr:unnamed protein product [Peronospora farinosa]
MKHYGASVQKRFANNWAFANRDSATAANGMQFNRLSGPVCTRLNLGPDYHRSGWTLISRLKLITAYTNTSFVIAMGVRFAIDKIVSLLAESICTA